MKNYRMSMAFFVFLLVTISCSIFSQSKDNQDIIIPTPEVAETMESGEASVGSAETELNNSQWSFYLSKVLTHNDADEYLFGLVRESFYNFNPQTGWYTVVIEIAARSNKWTEITGCPFQVTVIDSGGFERSATVGIGRSECYAQTNVPTGGQIKIVAFTEIPDNQNPEKIIITESLSSSQFNVSDAKPIVFSTDFNFSEWPTVPTELSLEIPDTALVSFNFGAAYFVDAKPLGYGMNPDISPGTQLFIPTRVENIGGFNIRMGNSWDYNWNNIIHVDGFDSEGNVSLGNKIWIMRRIRDTECCPPIPPGQFAEYDLLVVYWPSSTTNLEWIWFGITLSDGNSVINHYQFVADKPEALGTFNNRYPTDPTGMEWFDQPPPSQKP